MDKLISEANKTNTNHTVKFCDNTVFPEDKIICYENINGQQFPRVYWADIVEMYPSMWVCYYNAKSITNGKIAAMTVVALCNDELSEEVLLTLYDIGYPVAFRRTASCIGDIMC